MLPSEIAKKHCPNCMRDCIVTATPCWHQDPRWMNEDGQHLCKAFIDCEDIPVRDRTYYACENQENCSLLADMRAELIERHGCLKYPVDKTI